jgi:hypothetical protein
MKKIALLSVVGLFAIPGIAFAQAVPAEPQGCHGAATVFFKNLNDDPGHQGTAIGGNGNSDGSNTDGQAHSDAGRGAILQDFLANNCDVGSQAD